MFSTKNLMAVYVTCASVTFLFIVAHAFGRFKHFPRFFASDRLLVLAWLCFYPCEITALSYWADWGFYDPRLDHYDTGKGKSFGYNVYVPENRIAPGLKLAFAQQTLFWIGRCFLKLVFLLTYKRLFPKRLLLATNITIAAVIVAYIVLIGLVLFWCLPMDRNWSLDPEYRCLSVYASVPLFFGGVIHMIGDLVIYILPWFLLKELAVSVGARIMFFLGFICVALALVRYVFVLTNAVSSSMGSAFFCAENSVAIIVACLPVIRRLWMSRKVRQTSVVEVDKRPQSLAIGPQLADTTRRHNVSKGAQADIEEITNQA